MKALIKYLLSLCILLLSGYLYFTAQTGNIETPFKNLKGSAPITVSSIQDIPCTLSFQPASTTTGRKAIKADLVGNEVEEEEEEVASKKQLEKYLHATPSLAAQVRALFSSNGKISLACKNSSYTSSYRYIVFRVFRI
jgi:hypothetical protein